MTTPERLRIVVVDDDENVRKALQHLLRASGHDVRLFGSAEELLAQEIVADCFLFDVCLPMLNGVELAERIQARGCQVPIVLMTGRDQEFCTSVRASSALPLLLKPFDEEEILTALARARGETA